MSLTPLDDLLSVDVLTDFVKTFAEQERERLAK